MKNINIQTAFSAMTSIKYDLISAIIIACLLLSGCSPQSGSNPDAGASGIYIAESDGELSAQTTAMDTFMTVSVRDGSICGGTLIRCMELLSKIEAKLSVTLPESDVGRINSSDGNKTAVSAETYDLIARSLDYCRDTDGAIDITAYPLVKAWGFTTGDYRVPSAEELKGILDIVDGT